MPEGKERVVSETIKSKRVIGSANPIARKFRSLKSSIGGVCIAPILIIIAFGLLFYSEKFKKSSKVVEELALEEASEVTADSGMHKITGEPKVEKEATTSVVSDLGGVLYYTYKKEEYKEVEEVEKFQTTTVENGQDVEVEGERTKMVEKWTEIESQTEWGDFSLGNYVVKTNGANLKFDLEKNEYWKEDTNFQKLASGKSKTPQIGDQRIVIQYLPVDEKLLVVGEISGDTISKGEVFIISNKSDSELLSELKGEETIMYWALKGGSWLLLTIGFLSILGPVLSLLDFIPIAGQAANCAASVVGAILAAIIVLLGTLIIKFWYLCLVGLVVGVVGLIVTVVKLAGKKK